MAYRSLLGRPVGVPDSLAADEPESDVPWASAATLPPIDGYDRATMIAPTARRNDAMGDEDDREPRSGRGAAILLGLSGSAALGVALYAPDLVAAVRLNAPRRVSNPQPRPGAVAGAISVRRLL